MANRLIQAIIFILSISSICSAGLNAKITTTKEELNNFLQGAQAGSGSKLIFHNDGSLYYIDFSEETLSIHEIPATKDGILPVISPDGNYFVFAKGVTGDGQEIRPCTSYICKLNQNAVPVQVAVPAYVPRFIQNAKHPTVLYSTCAKHPQSGKFPFEEGCGAVLKKEFTNEQFKEADTVWRSGSYFAGLSYDEKYLGTAWLGDGKAYINNIGDSKPVIKMIHLKVKNNQTNTDTIFQINACNPSISSSRIHTDAMMFVDFGYAKPVHPTYTFPFQSAWVQHQFLYINNYNGDILRRIDQKFKPELTYNEFLALKTEDTKGQSFSSSWEFPEWSNHPYLAVATIAVNRTWQKNPEGTTKYEKICLINLVNGSILALVSTTDSSETSKTNLRWPGFWTNIPDNFSEEADWLTKPQAIHSKFKVFKNHSIRIHGNLVESDKVFNKISIYQLNGGCIWSSEFNSKSILLPKNIISNKVAIINLRYSDNDYEIIKFSSITN